MAIQQATMLEGQEIRWQKRSLFIRSFMHARTAETALHQRLEKAEQALKALNEHKQGKKRISDKALLEQEVVRILTHYQVAGLLKIRVIEEVHECMSVWCTNMASRQQKSVRSGIFGCGGTRRAGD